jgi:hypothetical protein
MAWPQNLSRVYCDGFPKTILPVIKRAMDEDRVKWSPNKTRMFIDQCTGEFEFADCLWEMTEQTELVVSIALLKGDPTAESLTYAVLKG